MGSPSGRRPSRRVPGTLTDVRGGYGAPTPAADAQHVFALFGSAVLACLDRDGKIIWRKDLPRHDFDVAIRHPSPILFEETVIVQADQNGKKSSMIAFDKKSGDIKWDEPRPELIFAHSTPIRATVNGQPQLICSHSNALEGVDPQTGKQLWSIESSGETASPAFGNDLVYVDTGRGGGGTCVDLAVMPPRLKWKSPGNQIGEGLGSPIIVDNVLYRLHRGDFLLARARRHGANLVQRAPAAGQRLGQPDRHG